MGAAITDGHSVITNFIRPAAPCNLLDGRWFSLSRLLRLW